MDSSSESITSGEITRGQKFEVDGATLVCVLGAGVGVFVGAGIRGGSHGES